VLGYTSLGLPVVVQLFCQKLAKSIKHDYQPPVGKNMTMFMEKKRSIKRYFSRLKEYNIVIRTGKKNPLISFLTNILMFSTGGRQLVLHGSTVNGATLYVFSFAQRVQFLHRWPATAT
jgi:hypothetical protein